MGSRTRKDVGLPPFCRVRGRPWCGLTVLKAYTVAGRDLGRTVYATEGCGHSPLLSRTGPAMVWYYNLEGAHYGWESFGWGRVHGGGRRIPLFRRVRGRPWCGLTILKAHHGWGGFWVELRTRRKDVGFTPFLLYTRPAMVWSYDSEDAYHGWEGWGRVYGGSRCVPSSVIYGAGYGAVLQF